MILGVRWFIPAGPPWNMAGPYDFDNDGFGDFVVSSSYAGQYCNGAYHYEAVSNDSVEIQWVYTFYDLSCDYDAYSSIAVGDLDGDNNQEIISLVDTSPAFLDRMDFRFLSGARTQCHSYLPLLCLEYGVG